jgi:hypothetical protein
VALRRWTTVVRVVAHPAVRHLRRADEDCLLDAEDLPAACAEPGNEQEGQNMVDANSHYLAYLQIPEMHALLMQSKGDTHG